MNGRHAKVLMVGFLVISVILLAGCQGKVYKPKNTIWYYPPDLPAAESAVEAARQAGKDKECPAEFKEAEKMKDEAYKIFYSCDYWNCRDDEATAVAREAIAKANALCPVKALPTASLSASPASILEGQCATLTWSTANATGASVDQGVGSVALSGSREVCPKSTTQYTITVSGEGGSKSASVTVTVSPPPPTASLSAEPASILEGQCATLTWSTANATGVSIDQGLGSLAPSGSRQVCPTSTTQYTVTVSGGGGSQTAAVTVSVTPRKVMVLPAVALFDFDKAELKPSGKKKIEEYREQVRAEMSQASKVKIIGHTDSRGSDEYNMKLSVRRAEAVRDYLIAIGVDASKLEVSGMGETMPVADNGTEEGRQKNRRVEVEVIGHAKQ